MRFLLTLPIHHVGGLGVVLRSFLSGASIVFDDKSLPYPDRIISAKAHMASLVPTQLYRLLQTDFPRMTTRLIIGGAGLSQKLYERALAKDLSIILTYGLTEMSSTVLLSFDPHWKNQLPYLGHPLKGREIKLSNQEILTRGSPLFSGYGIPPMRPIDDWFSTKDLGDFDSRYGYAIIGRKDFQFISCGENIQPEEIEMAILSLDQVEQAIVIPIFDEECGALPFAFIRSNLSFDILISQLHSLLPKHKIPIAVADMPLDMHFKPNRRQLIEFANKNYHRLNFSKRCK